MGCLSQFGKSSITSKGLPLRRKSGIAPASVREMEISTDVSWLDKMNGDWSKRSFIKAIPLMFCRRNIFSCNSDETPQLMMQM